MNHQRFHPERLRKWWPLHCIFFLPLFRCFLSSVGVGVWWHELFSMEVAGNPKASSPWKMAKNVRKLLEKTPKDMAVFSRDKLSDVKEGKDDNSSDRILEFQLESLAPEKPSSHLNSAQSRTARPHSRWHAFINRFRKKPLVHLPSLNPVVSRISRRKSRSARENVLALDTFNSSWKNFSLVELQTATNNFNQENLIGKGGYAEVYKGCLKDGQLIAVKRLTQGTPEEKVTGFLHELGIIAHVNHPNTAKLIGYGVQGGLHLVLQLSPLGSLASLLHVTKSKLEWSSRYKIAIGTAVGLHYLHEHCQRRIIHRDIKADNILLTEDYEPQICDFGLAKWLPKHWTHYNVSKFEGTFGYFAPEYCMHGIVDEKTDIYSFGVLLLELITGRRAVDQMQQSLVAWAKPLMYRNAVPELIDPALDEYEREAVDRFVMTASLCVEQSPVLRPRMDQVVMLLKGDKLTAGKQLLSRNRMLKRTYSNEIFDAAEYNSTKCLADFLSEDM